MPFPRQAVGRMAARLDVFHLVAWIAILAVVALDPAYLGQTTNLCAFRFVTGVDCPGCGLVRSWCATAHGHLGDAFALHLFGPATFAGLLVTLLAFRFTRASRPAGESFETWIARSWRDHAWVRVTAFGGAVAWVGWAGLRMWGAA